MGSTTCSNCGAIVPAGLHSCNSCGTPTSSSQNINGFCSNCGSPLGDKYAQCPQCGHAKTVANPSNITPQNPSSGTSPAMYKNEGTALVLAIVIGILGLSGIGHVYIGKISRGIALLIGTAVLVWVGVATIVFVVGIFLLIIGLVLFIWHIFDVRNLCREYNSHIQAHGAPPPNW